MPSCNGSGLPGSEYCLIEEYAFTQHEKLCCAHVEVHSLVEGFSLNECCCVERPTAQMCGQLQDLNGDHRDTVNTSLNEH